MTTCYSPDHVTSICLSCTSPSVLHLLTLSAQEPLENLCALLKTQLKDLLLQSSLSSSDKPASS